MVQGSPERDRRLRSGVCRPPRAARVKDGSVKSCDLSQRQAEVMDVDAEREKIAKEIAELERILDPTSSGIGVGVSESGLTLDSDADSLAEEDSEAAASPGSEEERWGEASNGEDDPKEKTLPEDPETCLQLNMVYQEIIQERLVEVSLLLAQNQEQQEEIMCDLAGSKASKVKDGKSLPPNLYIGHFMKPYFKDRVTGVGPPANEETREKAAQGIKAFEELLVTKWKNWEKALLRRSVVSDRLQRLLQPKLLKLEYLHQKRSRVTSEAERQVLEKQSREAEREVQDIRQLPEEALLGNRLDSHDWEKISNVNFEGGRSAEEIRKFWQNCEHPSINKQEWSGQEVDQLKALAAKHGHLQWQKIAKELGTNRSAFQCLQKYQQHNKALKRKEWTREEDRLLTQLVQEMRVGSHIPYRRIVYYMEGRDSMQLIYRWTKSLDPSLKKGFWAPEEDAKLLRAVAKYGEQDWFKIREEVPGRSDAQCRDRQLQNAVTTPQRNAVSQQQQTTEGRDEGSNRPFSRERTRLGLVSSVVAETRGERPRDATSRIGMVVLRPHERAGAAEGAERAWCGCHGRAAALPWAVSCGTAVLPANCCPPARGNREPGLTRAPTHAWSQPQGSRWPRGRSRPCQWRKRYLRRLHFSLKKGRWNASEEGKLLELIEKYGVGHWAKIASELPHRTGSQCLSKWKIMVRKKQSRGRRRRRPLGSVRWSSSSGDDSSADGSSGDGSSGDSEDSEPEEAPEAGAGGQALPSAQHTVPDMDLWVPARQSASELCGGGARGWPGRRACPPRASSEPQASRAARPTASGPAEEAGQAHTPSGTHGTSVRGIGHPGSADTHLSSSEEPADESGSHLLKVPLESVLQVLRTNTARRRQALKEKLRQPCPLSPSLGASPSDSGVAGPRVRRLWHRTVGNRQRWRGHALQRRLVERQLLVAMSPWVGDVVLPCTRRRPAAVHTRADGIGKQLRDAQLASTPVFTIFIQLFQIDTAGCMEVVRERKAQTPALLQAGTRDPVPGLLQMSSSQNPTGRSSRNPPAREAAKQSTGHKGSRGLQPCQAESSPPAPPPAPCGPRPKPKTVSELLREKRLREARARKATAPGTVTLPPQLLLSSPLILQPRLPQAPPTSEAPGLAATDTALSGPGIPAAVGLSTSGENERPSTLPVLDRTLASTEAAPAASRAPVPSRVLVSGHQGGLGQSQAPAASRKQGLPEAPLFLPAAPSPIQLPLQPLSLPPALGTLKGGPHVAASTPLPVTWVLTAQGLLPVPAVVGLPGAAGTSGPKGLSVTLPSSLPGMQVGQGPRPPGLSHPWQPPANVDTDSDSLSRTDLSTLPMLCQSQSSVEVGSDVACAPGGPFPGEAQVAREIAVPRIPSQATLLADHPEAKPPWSSQPPLQAGTSPGSGPGGTLGYPGPEGLTGPLGLERPPRPGPERGALDLDLLSQESEAAVWDWLRGQQGVCVPPLGSRLPYQPPALCSLRALSGLLLHKKALERRATSLVPSGAAGGLQASLGQVQRQLQDSPAYLLLKARFLAAFTLPALLATLSPHGVPTTLSVATRAEPESEDDLGELELTDGCSPSGPRAGPVATIPIQGAPDPEQGSDFSCLDGPDNLDVLKTRHAWHARKRRRLV
ncbi:snRNA-activating protein complex subunit 4 isoform X2 [Leptonychotes weddellii]|uniref:snRNA-activating protein complex subunit 4 isoform X2 n=1 Tax=Leptonychotes weddellii TaxID=9713 RepID=A0A7F8RV96_LEPWE|nr:snRNA-activating protein complex subunit 4 isoform X2 [Leptonychotes weddellii]